MAAERHDRYPAREAIVTRVSSDAEVPDEAPTALDPPRFTDAMLAEAAGVGDPPVQSERQPAPVTPDPRAGVRPAREPLSWWIAAFVVAVLGGCAGTLFGLWLVLG